MKQIYIPIFWKFSISIIIIVTIFGSINLIFIRSNVTLSLKKESEKRAKYIAKNLASQSVDPLLYGDYITLQKLVSEIRDKDSSVAYAFILAKKGNIVLHNFSGSIPSKLISSNSLIKNQKENIVILSPVNSDKGLIRDIAVPIIDGEVGTVRVGIYEKHIRSESQNILNMLLLMVGVFLIIGIVSAFVISLIITKPIKTISNFAQKLDFESLKYKTIPDIRPKKKLWGVFPKLFQTQDELYFLAKRFNNMVNRLIIAYKELEMTYTKFIETEKLASIGMLAAGVAHEINNPIAGLQSCIRRIKINPDNYIQNEKYIEMMAEATDKIENVVRNLLDYTRSEDTYEEKIHIHEIIEKAILLLAYRFEKYQIVIRNQINMNLPLINGSRNKLEQVFVNLLMNAIDSIVKKYESDKDVEKIIYITNRISQGFLFIIIEDTGIGIDRKHLEKIFDPFFTTKEISKGTGLGLYVCRKIINSHKGKLDVESKPNESTKFIIKLPVKLNE